MNIQERYSNTIGTTQETIGNLQETCRKHTGNMQETYKKHIEPWAKRIVLGNTGVNICIILGWSQDGQRATGHIHTDSLMWQLMVAYGRRTKKSPPFQGIHKDNKDISDLFVNYVFPNKNFVQTQKHVFVDQQIRFYVKFYVYIQILVSIGLNLGQNIKKFIFIYNLGF